jgi:NDP-sugar pyrophosphorylase family protein
MLDWVCDKVAEVSEDIHLVTNSRFAEDFRRWASGRTGITVHDDGTQTNEDRLGAIGDIQFVGIDDDLLAIAGDNLFDFSLLDYVAFWDSKGRASCVAVHARGELVEEFATLHVTTGPDGKATGYTGTKLVRFSPAPAARTHGCTGAGYQLDELRGTR